MTRQTLPYRIAFLSAGALMLQDSTAAVIGIDKFAYADGSIVDKTGGSGWNYERTDEAGAPAQTASDWDATSGLAQVAGGLLVTNGTGAKREFGGATEGAAAGTNEREGAFRGSGALFFSVAYQVDTLLAEGVTQWGGISSYDFGTEKLFFGMLSQTTATRFFSLGISGGTSAFTTIPITANTTYTIAGMVNFDTDLIGIWINPDNADTAASYDASVAYTGTNWATALRLASVSGANVSWDNLTVATTFSEVVPVPEASVSALALLGGAAALRRRRRI